jgi:K+-sensing histidine kinase KdpD
MTTDEQPLDAILASLAHDLRNPAAGVLSNLGYLRDELTDPDQLDAVNESISSLEKMIRIVQDAADLGRLRAGHFPLRLEPVTLRDLEEPLRQAVEPQLSRRVLRLRLPEGPITTDSALLLRGLANLLEHGVRQTPDGRSVELVGELRDGLVLEMVDGGAPFAPDAELTATARGGVAAPSAAAGWRKHRGLNLTFVSAVVTALHGSMDVSGRDDGEPGAVFRLRFPEKIGA